MGSTIHEKEFNLLLQEQILSFKRGHLSSRESKYICIYTGNCNSNASFSKPLDFSKMTDGPNFFHSNIMQKYN